VQVKLQKLQLALKTDFENGLTGEDLKERQAYFGENKKNLVKPSWRIALIQTFSVVLQLFLLEHNNSNLNCVIIFRTCILHN
jgi:hypothetical protein